MVSKVLMVPKWRSQYLANCRELRDAWVDWGKVGPIVERLRAQIEPLIKVDDKGLYGHEAFLQAIADGSGRTPGLKKFFTERQDFLRHHKLLSKD